MAKVGAPKGSGSKYTKELALQICHHLSEGKPMRPLLKKLCIGYTTIFDWIQAHNEFAVQYARARDIGHTAIEGEIQEIADTPYKGVIKTIKADGTCEIKEEDMLGHRRLQIDTRRWLLSKWNPMKYGEKATVDLTTHRTADEMTDDELIAIATRRGKGDTKQTGSA